MRIKFAFSLCAMVIALHCNTVLAATDMSVFGFKLGEILVLDECPFKMVGPNKIYIMDARVYDCLMPHFNGEKKLTSATVYFAWGDMPPMVNSDPGSLEVDLSDDGKLNYVFFTTYGTENQEADFQALKAKYGKPSSIKTTTEKNVFGAKYVVVHAVWKLSGLRVQFEGSLNDRHTGAVSIVIPVAVGSKKDTDADDEIHDRKL